MTRRVQTKLLLRRSGGLLPAVTLLKAAISELKIRMVNAVDLMRLQPAIEHPHGLSDEAFEPCLRAVRTHLDHQLTAHRAYIRARGEDLPDSRMAMA